MTAHLDTLGARGLGHATARDFAEFVDGGSGRCRNVAAAGALRDGGYGHLEALELLSAFGQGVASGAVEHVEQPAHDGWNLAAHAVALVAVWLLEPER